MAYNSFVFENNDGVSTIRLNDPEKLNALTFQVYADLEKIFADLADDNNTKVVVLTGTGKGFCSGGSVNDIIGPLLKMKGDELYKFTRMYAALGVTRETTIFSAPAEPPWNSSHIEMFSSKRRFIPQTFSLPAMRRTTASRNARRGSCQAAIRRAGLRSFD